MTQPSPGRARFSLFLDVLSLLVLGGAVGLYFTTRWSAAAPVPPSGGVLADSTYRPLRVLDSTGRGALLTPDSTGRGLLLLVFKSDCPACAAQKSEWIRLGGLARERAVEVVAVTLEELSPMVRAYLAEGSIPVRRLADPSLAFPVLQTSVVPATILITDRGRISFHAMGLLDPAGTRRLEDLF